MDHIRILRRALSITWNYRVLWIFGILLALTTGGGGNGGGGNGAQSGAQGGMPFEPPDNFRMPTIPPEIVGSIGAILVGLVCFIVLLAVAFTIIRVVAETALIRLVDRHESTGERSNFAEGWRLGWSRAAFRIWLIDLILGLLTFVVVIALLAVSLAPLLLWFTNNETAGVMGTVATIGLFLMIIIVIILVSVALSLLLQFFHRAAALENLGVIDSIRRGWAIVRRRPGDAIIMALILFALGLAYAIVMIPVVLVLVAAGVLLGGLPGLLAGYLVSLVSQGALPFIIGAVIGFPIFLLILILPLLFVGGLVQVFTSSTWTLTYREMVTLEG